MFFDLLSTFLNVLGDVKEGSAQQKAAAWNANTARYNQSVATKDGVIAQTQQRQANAQRLGQIRANIGASGFDLEGSGLDLLYSNAYQGEMDAQIAKYNYDTKAYSYGMEAKMDDQKAEDAGEATWINAASSALKGGASLYKDTADVAGTSPFRLG